MAKQRRANFSAFESISKNSRYVRLTESMMQSRAWRELDIYARALYTEIKRKHNGKPEGERNISFTYAEGRQIMSKAKFTQARDSLIEKGFIDLVRHEPYGAAPTIYGLSARWHNYGTDIFKPAQRPKSRPRTSSRKHFPKAINDHQKSIL